MRRNILISICTFFFGLQITHAATMYITPDKPTLGVNELSGATIYLNSGNQTVNNIEGSLIFDPSAIQVESIINSDSILTLWIEQPTFSNTTGKISFNGGVPNPGYKGSAGKIARVIFRTKKAGTSFLSFNSAAIYANDGLGTDITDAGTASSKATIAVLESSVTTPSIPNPAITTPINPTFVASSNKVPSKPAIESKDLPSEDTWYNASKATFAWKIPTDVTAVQLLHGSFANSVPQVVYRPAISQKTLTNLSDGTWYLHVRMQNNQGWGETTHRKFKIDNTKPTELSIETLSNEDTGDVSLKLSAIDKLSGIDRFDIKIEDETETISLKNIITEKGVSIASTTLPQVKPGMKQITALAFDKAGNSIEKSLSLEFKPPFIEKPTLLPIPQAIDEGSVVSIKGLTQYPSGKVNIYVAYDLQEAEKYTTVADNQGNFSLELNIKKGKEISINATAQNEFGLESEPTNNLTSLIKSNLFAKLLGGFSLSIDYIVIILLLIIIILLIAIIGLYRKLHIVKKQVRSDIDKTKVGVKEVFEVIKKENKKSAETLAKSKAINDEMGHTIEVIKEDLDQAEKYFTSRIKKIEKDAE